MNYTKQIDIYNYSRNLDQNVHISYRGPIDEKILQAIGYYIEGALSKHPKAGKKIFKIFIELAQNISYYSAEKSIFKKEAKEVGAGTVLIGESTDSYTFVTGNLVKNDDIYAIIEKSEIINSLDREGLREYKREQRKLPHGPKGGAHIGLIQVALTAAQPLDIEVTPVDDEHSFFSIAVKVNK
jgi:hypothetical protein